MSLVTQDAWTETERGLGAFAFWGVALVIALLFALVLAWLLRQLFGQRGPGAR